MAETKVVTGADPRKPSLFSYAHVWEPYVNPKKPTEKGKYQVAILIPKNAKIDIEAIEEAIEAAKQQGIRDKKYSGKVIESKFKTPLYDGDEKFEEDEEKHAVYEGHWYINAKSNTKPGVVDEDVNPILDQSEFYSGCFGRAAVTFYPYESEGTKGVAVALNNVQKTKDGEQLGGGNSKPEDDFGPASGGSKSSAKSKARSAFG